MLHKIHTIILCLVLFLPAVSVTAEDTNDRSIPDLGTRLELFVDNFLVESMNNVAYKLHEPRDEGVAFAFDAPWEDGFATYVTVLDDGVKKRAYYRASGGVTCCAESDDGIHWTKPEYNIINLGDAKKLNNAIWGGDGDHNFTPFVDKRPGVPPEEKYKALGGIGRLLAFISSDGVHWKKLSETPVIQSPNACYMFDSQNVAFWSESEQKYVCYMRYTIDHHGPNELRSVARATSDDFIHWSTPEPMTFDDPQVEHLYTNQTCPYFRAPHIYLATAARFVYGQNAVDEEMAKEIHVVPGYLKIDLRFFNDCSDAVLLTTRGGVSHYDRLFRESLIRPGIEPGNWASRSNYPAAGLIQTSESEMSMYVVRFYQQAERALYRYSIRLDGFVSVQAGYDPGELITRPFRFSGQDLILNFATGAAGRMQVELLDEAGTPIPGYSREESPTLVGNKIAKKVVWQNDRHAGELAGKVVKLKFYMKEVDLYSLVFRDNNAN